MFRSHSSKTASSKNSDQNGLAPVFLNTTCIPSFEATALTSEPARVVSEPTARGKKATRAGNLPTAVASEMTPVGKKPTAVAPEVTRVAFLPTPVPSEARRVCSEVGRGTSEVPPKHRNRSKTCYLVPCQYFLCLFLENEKLLTLDTRMQATQKLTAVKCKHSATRRSCAIVSLGKEIN